MENININYIKNMSQSYINDVFDYEHYLKTYPDLKVSGINTYEKALEHWNTYGKYEFREATNSYNKLKESYMNNILFCIGHHSTDSLHTDLLRLCLKSIRENYPLNDIVVVKTSITKIPNDVYNYNISVVTKDDDDSIFWGCYREICKLPHKYYVFIHDSMCLLKKLPINILDKKIYPLWHFDTCLVLPEDALDTYLSVSKLNNKGKENVKLLYHQFGKKWFGFFGSAFGGQTEYLKILLNVINYNFENKHLFCSKKLDGKNPAEYSERYLSLISNVIGIIHKDDIEFSLNGNIIKQWNIGFMTSYNFEDPDNINLNKIKEYCDIFGYSGYFFKKLCLRIS